MKSEELEPRIQARGREFFAEIGNEAPSIFNKSRWVGKLIDWCMTHEVFKVQLFRFIDVMPYLTTSESLGRHIKEYFGQDEEIPAIIRWGLRGARLGGRLAMNVLGGLIRKNLEMMAHDFIVGASASATVARLGKLRKLGFAFTLDLLGEATVGEAEAEAYEKAYLDVLSQLADAQRGWAPLGAGEAGLDWGCAPKVNLSVKASALFSQTDAVDFEGSVRGILARLKPIYRAVMGLGGFLCIDMESRRLKNITFELYRCLRSDPEFRGYPHLGMAVQAYLRETDEDLDQLLAWARSEGLPIAIRLVKGAYWDYETVVADQSGWPVPVYTAKAQTDASFERNAEKLLRNHDVCYVGIASHNVRSVSAALETARALGVPEDRYEFQLLYGMAEPFRKTLQKRTGRVRLYCPFGELLPGMAYLIRRLLENTSNESFLRQEYVEAAEIDRLLAAPQDTPSLPKAHSRIAPSGGYDGEKAAQYPPEGVKPSGGSSEGLKPSGGSSEGLKPSGGDFAGEPFPDWTRREVRDAYARGIAEVRGNLGRTYPLFIGGKEITTEDLADSVNPAQPAEVIGRVCQAGTHEIEAAIAAARQALPAWSETSPRERAGHLLKAAEAGRRRLFELSAWQTLEAGKQWNEAYLDVTESIDYLEYYAREMIRVGEPRYLGGKLGEANEYFYRPKGIAAVIAPWNFPLAISCGMAAAALVAGNCVVYKPSGFTAIIGHTLGQLFREAGLPPGVFNLTPGRSQVMGDFLIDHPAISLIAFTGSMEVGLRIVERAGRTPQGQPSVKRVIAEMGGKNAIVIDDDADLDEAVPAVLMSAFGYQGQKCSACSRVIVLDGIYDRFLDRLVGVARSVKIGPAEDPGNFMGPVIDRSAQRKILEYVEVARQEGSIAFSSLPKAIREKDLREGSGGFYVPLTIVTGITPEHRIAQEEIFGPVLAVMRAPDFDQAIEWANSTRFALTGGAFSRSPKRLARCRREIRVGNLYLNRGCTGALVGRQPFGGFRMSGVGSKAGGPDYLLQFMDPCVATENTMRRGFVPVRRNG